MNHPSGERWFYARRTSPRPAYPKHTWLNLVPNHFHFFPASLKNGPSRHPPTSAVRLPSPLARAADPGPTTVAFGLWQQPAAWASRGHCRVPVREHRGFPESTAGMKTRRTTQAGAAFHSEQDFSGRGRCVAAPFDSGNAAPNAPADQAPDGGHTRIRKCEIGRKAEGVCPARSGSSHETIFLIARNAPETIRRLQCHQQKGGVMDIVVSLLALISIGVFAAHTFDALRAG